MQLQESAPKDNELKWTFPDTRYAIRQLLAVGGSARVFAAEQRFMSRMVAIKVPNPRHTRSLDEIEALVRGRGEGVVNLLDAGEVRNRPYLVLELLEGRPLSGLLAARQALTPHEVVKVAVEVASTLARCHRAGVIHRDIKPANLFVTTCTSRQVTIIDFGVARVRRGDDRALRPEPTIVGTREYMAPEVARGEAASERSDQYSLGVTLYECLTGSLPHADRGSDWVRALSVPQGGVGTVVADPSKDLRLDIPTALRQIVGKLLSQSPRDRYASMDEVVAALRGCFDRDPTTVDLLGRNYDELPLDNDARSRATVEEPNRAYKRRHPRAPYSTLARAFRAGSTVDGRIEEISEGGLQLLAAMNVQHDETVMIRFALPVTGKIVDVVGKARWSRTCRNQHAIGFEIVEISETARAEIRRYVSIISRAA